MSRRITRLATRAWLLALSVAAMANANAQNDPREFAVQLSAAVQEAPARITLAWAPGADATAYSVYRRTGEISGWNLVSRVAGSVNGFEDANITPGLAYEYQVIRSTSLGYTGHGYISAGIKLPLVENRGTVVLLVESSIAASLAVELSRLEMDLIGDGWKVMRHDVSRTASVVSVKNLILGDYWADPAVRSVFLFGHIPVPYAGDITPDLHANHRGAWPADVYYADVSGRWTDSTVSIAVAERTNNWNRPGDGKFDQSQPPSDDLLAVGRVDLSNLMDFLNNAPVRSEVELLRQYLNKDHSFRHRLFTVQRRALLCDNFGVESGVAYAASGFMNFGPLVGAQNVKTVGYNGYFPTVRNEDYLWSYACGGGSYTSCNGIGVSRDFSVNDIRTVFTMFFGSYYGDWDTESNFLRSVLGSSSYTLTAACAGLPHWYFHHMALGETVGYSTRVTQKNNGVYGPAVAGRHQVHVGLMGDPTLRMHPVLPVSSLVATQTPAGINLQWNASTDDAIQGYYVYRATSGSGSFTRVTPEILAQPRFTNVVAAGTYSFMIRALKLETTPSGTYTNASQGVFVSVQAQDLSPFAPSQLAAFPLSDEAIRVSWTDNATNETGFAVERKIPGGSFVTVTNLIANTSAFTDAGLTPATPFIYRVRAGNAFGFSSYSSETGTVTFAKAPAPGAAAFVKFDNFTSGTWTNSYGVEGIAIAGVSNRLPAFVQIVGALPPFFSWAQSTTDTRAPLLGSDATSRTASAWFSDTEFSFDLNITDGERHRLAFYAVDWESANRSERVDLIEPVSGAVLSSQVISNFAQGVYVVWEVSGRVLLRVTRLSGPNAVASALFVDPPGVAPVRIRSETFSSLPNPVLRLELAGEAGLTFVLDQSTNLFTWKSILTNEFPGPTLELWQTNISGSDGIFYRARWSPP